MTDCRKETKTEAAAVALDNFQLHFATLKEYIFPVDAIKQWTGFVFMSHYSKTSLNHTRKTSTMLSPC